MSQVYFQRGYNNTFYYATNSLKGTDVEVNELTLNRVGNSWSEHIENVFIAREGKIIALEMDMDNRQ